MWLADIKLHITPTAKKSIQEKVDHLTRSSKHFQGLLDRANLFLPLVARVLQEEGIPPDFQYQVIQESALISDAVHSSNSVGFWQFKKPAALESGLKINSAVDERMHITAATRGAARYLKRYHQYADNWLYALLAYNRGWGYVQKLNYKKYRGVKRMRIDSHTHWYIIHFLAHKLAFKDKLGREQHPVLRLHEYEEAHGKTLAEIAREFGVDQKQLQAYNKWLKRYRVPNHVTCATIIPMTHQQYAKSKVTQAKQGWTRHKLNYAQYWERAAGFPVITTQRDTKSGAVVTRFNGLMGTRAQRGDSLSALARAGKLSLKRFLAINDLDKKHQVVPGQVYYYQYKPSKAGIHFHIARPGETWWSVAQ
ncbi:MAG: transglycosylase SLT domain-containing protein, partial [Bacteroidota bacterium]